MTQKQYALVHNGGVVLDEKGLPVVSGFAEDAPRGYSAKHPEGCVWLPVETRDSAPFDIRRHWRKPPRYEVHGDRVLRIREVIPIMRH